MACARATSESYSPRGEHNEFYWANEGMLDVAMSYALSYAPVHDIKPYQYIIYIVLALYRPNTIIHANKWRDMKRLMFRSINLDANGNLDYNATTVNNSLHSPSAILRTCSYMHESTYGCTKERNLAGWKQEGIIPFTRAQLHLLRNQLSARTSITGRNPRGLSGNDATTHPSHGEEFTTYNPFNVEGTVMHHAAHAKGA